MDSDRSADLVVRDAVLEGNSVDIVVRDGVIVGIGAGIGENREGEQISASGGIIVELFAEPHSHPDKVFSRERIGSLGLPTEGPRPVLMQRQRDLKSHFTVEDVTARATRFLRESASHGVGVIAGQADIDSVTGLNSVRGLLLARDANAHLVQCVVTAFPQEGIVADPTAKDLVAQALVEGADRVGGWPNNEADETGRLEHLRVVFELAERFGKPIDINVDYFTDPTERLLEPLAEMTIATGMQGLVNANHVGALETYDDSDAQRVIDRVAEAGITVTVCPSNLAGSYPYRGVSRPNELLDAGVVLAVGTGNYEDNWEHLGTLDPLERARFAWHALPLAHRQNQGIEDAWRVVGANAWAAAGLSQPRIELGASADFVVIGAPSRLHALRNEASSRWVVRGGRLIARTEVAMMVHGSLSAEEVG